MKIIGLAGFSGSGKNYTAALIRKLRPAYQQDSFAHSLKMAMSAIYGFNHNQLNSLEREVRDDYWDATPRQLMQTVGTEVFRAYDPDIWIKSLALRTRDVKKLVITDVRFQNEVDWIHAQGGRFIFSNQGRSGLAGA